MRPVITQEPAVGNECALNRIPQGRVLDLEERPNERRRQQKNNAAVRQYAWPCPMCLHLGFETQWRLRKPGNRLVASLQAFEFPLAHNSAFVQDVPEQEPQDRESVSRTL